MTHPRSNDDYYGIETGILNEIAEGCAIGKAKNDFDR
jgi:hypothetical protein